GLGGVAVMSGGGADGRGLDRTEPGKRTLPWWCRCPDCTPIEPWGFESPTMRIGIVNDMALAREALRRVVLSSPDHEVAWMAGDGAEAVARARADPPDLILMDLFMPGVDGVEATRRIMGESPCAILVVTATIAG